MAKAKKTEIGNKPAESGKKTSKGQKSLAPKVDKKAASGKKNKKGKAETKEITLEKGRPATKKISVRSEINRLEKKNGNKDTKSHKVDNTRAIIKDAPKHANPKPKAKSKKTESGSKSAKKKQRSNIADSSLDVKQPKKNSGSKFSVKKPSISKKTKAVKDISALQKEEKKTKIKSETSVGKTDDKKKPNVTKKAKNKPSAKTISGKKVSNVNASPQNRDIKNSGVKSSVKSGKKDASNVKLSKLEKTSRVKESEKPAKGKHAPILVKKKITKTTVSDSLNSIKPAEIIPEDIAPQIKREKKVKLGETKDLWEFYSDQDGDFLAKLYTEDKTVYTELLKIKDIKRSAKYFRNGSFIGADFIIPIDRLKLVCGIAGLKAPKI